MSYTLTPFPEWTLDQGRDILADNIKRILFLERDRLKSFDIVDYEPQNPMDAMNLARMGFDLERMTVCQVVGHLQYAGDEGHTKIFRTHIPRNLAMHDLAKIGMAMGDSMLKQCRIMKIEEKRRKAPVVANDDPLSAGIKDAIVATNAGALERARAYNEKCNHAGMDWQDVVLDPAELPKESANPKVLLA